MLTETRLGPWIPSVALVLAVLVSPIPAASVEPKGAVPPRLAEQPGVSEPTVSSPLREAPNVYVFEDDRQRIEFMEEGWLLRFKPKEGSAVAYWLVEIYGNRGPVLWTRERESLGFGTKEGAVRYARTPLLTEEYRVDRYGFRQVWSFSDNPAWEGGDILIVGEMLTPLEVRIIEGKIHFFDRDGWVGSFCAFEAQGAGEDNLPLAPKLEGKKITLTVPGSWLYRLGRPRR